MKIKEFGSPRLVLTPAEYIQRHLLPLPFFCTACKAKLEVDSIYDLTLHEIDLWWQKRVIREPGVVCPLCQHRILLNSVAFYKSNITDDDIDHIKQYLLDQERDSLRDIARDAYVAVLRATERTLRGREQGRGGLPAWTVIAVIIIALIVVL